MRPGHGVRAIEQSQATSKGKQQHMKVVIYSALSAAAFCLFSGLASADPTPITTPEPEPAGRSCFGMKPMCFVNTAACCICDAYGNNCSWSCCKK